MLAKLDSDLINKIEQKTQNDGDFWDYKSFTRKDSFHNILRYPATMVPEMQQEIMGIICDTMPIKSVLDPFMGSGTVLVEGIKRGLDVYGMDINPLSYLLTKSKLSYVSVRHLESELERLKTEILTEEHATPVHSFNNIDKWFREDIKYDLTKARNVVLTIRNKRVREFFLIALSDVITQVKNSQSSTFKLHIKSEEKIANFKVDVIESFIDKCTVNINLYREFLMKLKDDGFIKKHGGFVNNIRVECGDTRNLQSKLKLADESIDMIVTSPPYGDNQTTVTYGQFSYLPLLWIDNPEYRQYYHQNLLNWTNAIDKASLGGILYSQSQIEDSLILDRLPSLAKMYDFLVKENAMEKASKVASFIIDFDETINQMYRVLKRGSYMVFVTGNRRVHNKEVPFDSIIKECTADRFTLVTQFDRTISNKKMAGKISKVGDGAVASMSSENIMVLKKK